MGNRNQLQLEELWSLTISRVSTKVLELGVGEHWKRLLRESWMSPLPMMMKQMIHYSSLTLSR